MKIIGVLVFSICFFSCAQIEPRAPLNKERTMFLNSSAQRNKELLLREEQLLVESAEKDSLLYFRKSEAGFLYAYVKKTTANSHLPVKGDLVHFQYKIED